MEEQPDMPANEMASDRAVELDEHGRPYDFFFNPSPRHVELMRERIEENDADRRAGLGIPWQQAMREAFGASRNS